MQGAGKTFNTGTEDWKWWASSSIIALACYFWKREIFIFIWQATWDRQICWRAVLILPYFKPLRTGLLLSVFSVFHIFILMRYLRLSFLPVWANPCLSGPLISCKNINHLSYCSNWKERKFNSIKLTHYFTMSLIPGPLTMNFQGKVSATSSSSEPPGDVIVVNTALLALLFHYNNAAAVQPARGWPPAISLQICR